MRFSRKTVQRYRAEVEPDRIDDRKNYLKSGPDDYAVSDPKYKFGVGKYLMPPTRIRYRLTRDWEASGKTKKRPSASSGKKKRTGVRRPRISREKARIERNRLDEQMEIFSEVFANPEPAAAEHSSDSLQFHQYLRDRLLTIHDPNLFRPGQNQGRVLNWSRSRVPYLQARDTCQFWAIEEVWGVYEQVRPTVLLVCKDLDPRFLEAHARAKRRSRDILVQRGPQRYVHAFVPVVINRHPIAIFASLDDHLKFILERVDASARPEIFRYAGEQIVKDFYGNRGVPFEFLDDSLREAAEAYNDFPYIIEDTL